jgi:hypothetical protein
MTENLRGTFREGFQVALDGTGVKAAWREPIQVSRKPVPKAHGKPNPTGEEEAFIAHEIGLQADHARFLGIDDLQAQAWLCHSKPR